MRVYDEWKHEHIQVPRIEGREIGTMKTEKERNSILVEFWMLRLGFGYRRAFDEELRLVFSYYAFRLAERILWFSLIYHSKYEENQLRLMCE